MGNWIGNRDRFDNSGGCSGACSPLFVENAPGRRALQRKLRQLHRMPSLRASEVNEIESLMF